MKLAAIQKKLTEQIRDSSPGIYLVIAATLDKRGTIAAIGINSYTKTHPKQKYFALMFNSARQYLHAEIAALVKTRTKPNGLMVLRFGKDGRLRMAKPCPICMMAAREAGVVRCYWSNEKGEIDHAYIFQEACKKNRSNLRTMVWAKYRK